MWRTVASCMSISSAHPACFESSVSRGDESCPAHPHPTQWSWCSCIPPSPRWTLPTGEAIQNVKQTQPARRHVSFLLSTYQWLGLWWRFPPVLACRGLLFFLQRRVPPSRSSSPSFLSGFSANSQKCSPWFRWRSETSVGGILILEGVLSRFLRPIGFVYQEGWKIKKNRDKTLRVTSFLQPRAVGSYANPTAITTDSKMNAHQCHDFRLQHNLFVPNCHVHFLPF